MDNPLAPRELPKRDFDEVYDSVAARNPNASSEKLIMLTDLAMRIRQNCIEIAQLEDCARERCEETAISEEHYRGWKLLRESEHDRELTGEDFRENIEYLKQWRPETLLFYLPLFEVAARHGVAAAQAEKVTQMHAMKNAVEQALTPVMEAQLHRLMKVMNKDTQPPAENPPQ